MQYIEVLRQLEPYMENLDDDFLNTTMTELASLKQPTVLETAALGLIYHDLCVLHFLRGKDKNYAPYAQKSLETLRAAEKDMPEAGRPIIAAYIVSARSLVAAVKGSLPELFRVIRAYDKLIARDGAICYCPAFLQGSLLENLPNVLGAHKKAARRFRQIIDQHVKQPAYASDKIIGFCYLSLSRFARRPHEKAGLRSQSLSYDTDGTIAKMLVEQV